MSSLDKIITLNIQGEGHRETEGDAAGRYVEGAITAYPGVWAQLNDLGSGQEVNTSNSLLETISYRNYTIRWRPDVARSVSKYVSVVDEYGRTWTSQKIRVVGRQRFIELECSGRDN